MKTIWRMSLILLLGLNLNAQSNDPIVMSVGSEKVSLSEFEAIFKKNNQEKSIRKAELDEYMDLFRVFKLKVYDAKQQGLDTSAAFKRELQAYVKQLAKPFLRDTAAERSLVMNTWNRMQTDRKIRQIYLELPVCASPSDTLKAYNKLEDIRRDIKRGKVDFGTAAKNYSEDERSAGNGGLIGWFTAPNAALDFERAVYDTPVGGLSRIVRSSIGYHLIMVEEERPARGRVEVSHIFVSADASNSGSVEIARKRILEAKEKAMSGTPWEEVVRAYSENYKTATRAGKLPSFGINEYAPDFEQAAFSLKKVGDISEPILTPQGFHLLRLEQPAGLPAFAEFEDELTKMLAKSARWKEPKRVFVQQLKAQYSFTEPAIEWNKYTNEEGLISLADLEAHKDLVLANFQNNTLSVATLLDYLEAERLELKALPPCLFHKNYVVPFFESVLLGYKEQQLPQENQKFRYLVNEYREGILLFGLMDEKVWKRSVRDSSGLGSYFADHRDRYRWEQPRMKAWLVDCKNEEAEKLARKYGDKVASGKWDISKFTGKLNKNVPDNVLVTQGTFLPGDHPVVDLANQQVGLGATSRSENKIRFAMVTEVLAPGPKELSDVRGKVISDYASWLEQSWIEELEKKYPVTINKEVLYRLVTQ